MKHIQKSTKLIITPQDDSNLWETDWTITLREEPKCDIGTVTFRGEKSYGKVPIHITLDERFRNKGYGTEAFKMMTDWAFLFKNVYEIEAVTEHENDKCIIALEKAGFVYRTKEDNIETYSITKQPTTWLGIYIFIGITAGLVIGVVLGNNWAGLAIGLFAGIFIGAGMDAQAKKDREKIIGRVE